MERQAGVISGWGQITTQDPDENGNPKGEHTYTLTDFYLILRDLKSKLDPEVMARIEKLIVQHTNDVHNPHETTFDQLGLDVMQFLYDLWLAQGNVGPKETFLKILFQYVKIADLETTLAGTTMEEIPSIRGVISLITRHNTDPDAHHTLLASILPGQPVETFPAFSLQASAGLPHNVVVERNSPCSYIDANGLLKTAGPNILPIDHSFGEAMFGLWGSQTNYIPYSEDLGHPAIWASASATVQFAGQIINPKGELGAYKLVEAADIGSVPHVLTCTPGVDCLQNEGACISVFVRPAERYCFGIAVPQDIGGPYSFVHFNLDTQQVFINDQSFADHITGGIIPLANGWFRCWYALRTTMASQWSMQFYPLDIYDGDNSYSGDGTSGLYLWGAQLNAGVSPGPYIANFGVRNSLADTAVIIPASNWYNYSTGTVVLEYATPTHLDTDNPKELYSLATGTSQIALNAKYPMAHKGRAFLSAFGSANNTLINKWTISNVPAINRLTTLIHSYNATTHLFGFPNGDPVEAPVTGTVNDKITELYLGCDRYKGNPFNGLIRSFTFYPSYLSLDNAKFLLGA